MNFWYGVEEDVYLKASTLGSAMVTTKKYGKMFQTPGLEKFSFSVPSLK